MKSVIAILCLLMVSVAQAELKYERPDPVITSAKSEAKCQMAENAQGILTEASTFMKTNWNVGKVEDKAKLDELVKKIGELHHKLGYAADCYHFQGDYKGARLFGMAMRDLNRFDRRLYRANGPVRGGRFEFPFPGGHFELDIRF